MSGDIVYNNPHASIFTKGTKSHNISSEYQTSRITKSGSCEPRLAPDGRLTPRENCFVGKRLLRGRPRDGMGAPDHKNDGLPHRAISPLRPGRRSEYG